MKFLFLNQSFHPDVAASGQYLCDLAAALVQRGHQVTVISARRACDNPRAVFPRAELWRGVRIWRVTSTGFGKAARWCRLLDGVSLLASMWWRGCRVQRPDLVMALTSPPLVGTVGWFLARLHRAALVHWVLDLNPDEAIAAGWLDSQSLTSKVLEAISRRTLRAARHVVVLDRFMDARVAAKGVDPRTISVRPLWSEYPATRFDLNARTRFRSAHGWTDKFVVMYSGNHSPCHPLSSILGAAALLAEHTGILFCFIGGGSEFRRIQAEAEACGKSGPHSNLVFLPYQPRAEISASLSAADAHLVVMGDAFVGIVHPSKVYNLLALGSPILYVGPQPSPISDVLLQFADPDKYVCVRHGEAGALARHIERMYAAKFERSASFVPASMAFCQAQAMNGLLSELERLAPNAPLTPIERVSRTGCAFRKPSQS